MQPQYQAIILGGGPAGATAAALLTREGRRVALLDNRRAAMPDSDLDPRVVAVSPGSRNVLDAAGGWERLPTERVCAFAHMHVESGDGAIDFNASEHGLDWLGWIAELPAIQAGLWRALQSAGAVELLAPRKAVAARLDGSLPELELDDGRVLRAELLIAADGARSWLRRQAGIGVEQWHYNQRAVVCHLDTSSGTPSRPPPTADAAWGGEKSPRATADAAGGGEKSPPPGARMRFRGRPGGGPAAFENRCAWQRFTKDGPLALLPLPEGRLSLVWSLPEGKARDIASLDEADFMKRLSEASGEPFGSFESATRRFAFPLIRQRAEALTGHRLALVGDAGRTVHPLAGQGMNLGLMDAAALAECLEDWQAGEDPAHRLDRYRRWRTGAGELMAGGIHAINELFAVKSPLLKPLRDFGLKATGATWPAREMFVRRACGLDDDAPRLCRGV